MYMTYDNLILLYV